MAHNIAQINGKECYVGRQAAWHNLGQVTGHAMTWRECLQLAGLDWEVEKMQLIHPITHYPLPGAYGTFRRADNDLVFLGTVGNSYVPIQNSYTFEFVDALLEQSEGAHYETAGALGNGERVWCLANLCQSFDVAGIGDKHESYLLFTTSHDGSLAATCKLTSVRVVCQNTLNRSLRQNNGATVKIKHTIDAKNKLDQAKKLVTASIITNQDLERKLNILAHKKATKESIKSIMKGVFGEFEGEKKNKKVENKIDDVLSLFHANDNNTFPEISGTLYNLNNAITEYYDFYASVRQTESRQGVAETYLRSENALFGLAADRKENALELILHEVEKCPDHQITKTMISMAMDSKTPLLDQMLQQIC